MIVGVFPMVEDITLHLGTGTTQTNTAANAQFSGTSGHFHTLCALH